MTKKASPRWLNQRDEMHITSKMCQYQCYVKNYPF